MSATIYGKWYWSDWMSDPGVRASSYAARGLWIDLLCIAATADPTGYVVLNGRPLIASDIARLTGGSASEVETLLDELERNGVFTRDRNGRIYSRRMAREAKNAKLNRENGKKGGNPSLRKQSENSRPVIPPVKPEDKTQKPEARSQKPAEASCARDLRLKITEAFRELVPARLPPDTNRAVVWLKQGFDPDLILSVVREVLARKPDVGSLSYFDRRIEEIHARPASVAGPARGSAPPRKPVTPEMIRYQQMHLASEHFRGHWSDAWPNHCRPGHPDCTTPHEVIEDARIAVSMESLPNPNIAREMGFAPDRFSRFQ